jgi:DNA-binding NarL/FixJ family response regulator
MTNYAYPWPYYADLQQRSAKLTRLSDYWWGMERGMVYLLDAIAAGTVPSDPDELVSILNRTIASAARAHRSRSGTLAYYTPIAEPPSFDDTAAEARIKLTRAMRLVSSRDGDMLVDAGFGFTDREIAERHGLTPGAVRVRISRLRLKLAA